MKDQSAPPASAPVSSRPTAAMIDLSAIEHNFREVVRRAGGRKVLADVKAHAATSPTGDDITLIVCAVKAAVVA